MSLSARLRPTPWVQVVRIRPAPVSCCNLSRDSNQMTSDSRALSWSRRGNCTKLGHRRCKTPTWFYVWDGGHQEQFCLSSAKCDDWRDICRKRWWRNILRLRNELYWSHDSLLWEALLRTAERNRTVRNSFQIIFQTTFTGDIHVVRGLLPSPPLASWEGTVSLGVCVYLCVRPPATALVLAAKVMRCIQCSPVIFQLWN